MSPEGPLVIVLERHGDTVGATVVEFMIQTKGLGGPLMV